MAKIEYLTQELIEKYLKKVYNSDELSLKKSIQIIGENTEYHPKGKTPA